MPAFRHWGDTLQEQTRRMSQPDTLHCARSRRWWEQDRRVEEPIPARYYTAAGGRGSGGAAGRGFELRQAIRAALVIETVAVVNEPVEECSSARFVTGENPESANRAPMGDDQAGHPVGQIQLQPRFADYPTGCL